MKEELPQSEGSERENRRPRKDPGGSEAETGLIVRRYQQVNLLKTGAAFP